MSAGIPAGAMRFNSDSQKLEYWNGSAWFQVHTATPNLATAGDPTPGARGLFMGGYAPSPNGYLDEILYINIASTGNSISFGELIVADRVHITAGTSDKTRAIAAGGYKLPGTNSIDMEFVTIASTGDAVDFGANLTVAKSGMAGASNGTRGIFAGGYTPTIVDVIEYITIQSTGVAAQDFGDLTLARKNPASMCSSTRGVFWGGRTPTAVNVIDFITMSTLGDAQDFGDLTEPKGLGTQGITSNPVRGIMMGGYNGSAFLNSIEYITITSTGNALDFGDLLTIGGSAAGVASPTRSVMMGGQTPGYINTIQYVQIMTTGNSVDFGDLNTIPSAHAAGASNAHGGL